MSPRETMNTIRNAVGSALVSTAEKMVWLGRSIGTVLQYIAYPAVWISENVSRCVPAFGKNSFNFSIKNLFSPATSQGLNNAVTPANNSGEKTPQGTSWLQQLIQNTGFIVVN